ncbi:hypothetical protein BD779DRAFT_1803021 [Infundibulicybe gibba]|nr:hypothetical protein BD779DRAFT_1803021 [Infundibulicybe gibba]
MSNTSSREDGSTTPAHQDHGSCVNVSAGVAGPRDATFLTLKERKYSAIHDAFRDVVGAEGDVASATPKQWSASRLLPLPPESGNTTPTAHQVWGWPHPRTEAQMPLLRGMFESSNPMIIPTTCPPTVRHGPDLIPAVGLIVTRLKQDGRLIYIGAGATDCSLGVLDATELPRKFSASPASFIRLIAGGAMAVEHATRDAEDVPNAVADLGALMSPLTPSDALIGVVTSRSMAYVLAGMSHARALGALTIGIAYTNWSTPGDPGVCECVVECDPRIESEGESSEIEKSREIRLVLTKLSNKLGGTPEHRKE